MESQTTTHFPITGKPQVRKVRGKATNRSRKVSRPPLSHRQRGETRKVEPRAADQAMPPERTLAVQQALKVIDESDRGTESDGRGFCRVHIEPGRRLAQRPELTPKEAAYARWLVLRYRRQVPPSLLDAIFGDVSLADLEDEMRRTAKNRSRNVPPYQGISRDPEAQGWE